MTVIQHDVDADEYATISYKMPEGQIFASWTMVAVPDSIGNIVTRLVIINEQVMVIKHGSECLNEYLQRTVIK